MASCTRIRNLKCEIVSFAMLIFYVLDRKCDADNRKKRKQMIENKMGKCQLQMSLELSVLREAKLSHYLLVMHVLAANENRPHASTLFENRFHSTLSNACQVQPNSLVHCLFKLHLQDGQNTSCVRLRQRTIQETPHSYVFIFSLSLLYFKKKRFHLRTFLSLYDNQIFDIS